VGAPGGGPGLSGPAVLVVDDAADLLLLYEEVLGAAGFAVTRAAGGAEALALVGPQHAAVVLDLQMPGVDGWTVLGRMRADPALDPVAVLVCSVKGAHADELRAWRLGCDGYLPKPFGLEALVAAVREVIARPLADRPSHRAARIAALEAQAERG
jgi:two-component system chemotaxis response regulator CheY